MHEAVWKFDDWDEYGKTFCCSSCRQGVMVNHSNSGNLPDECPKCGADMRKSLRSGEYVIYQNGDRFELGKIKRLCEDGAFVYYSSGETAAKTPYANLHKITNEYVISETELGGENG